MEKISLHEGMKRIIAAPASEFNITQERKEIIDNGLLVFYTGARHNESVEAIEFFDSGNALANCLSDKAEAERLIGCISAVKCIWEETHKELKTEIDQLEREILNTFSPPLESSEEFEMISEVELLGRINGSIEECEESVTRLTDKYRELCFLLLNMVDINNCMKEIDNFHKAKSQPLKLVKKESCQVTG